MANEAPKKGVSLANQQPLIDLFDRYVPVLSIAEKTRPFPATSYLEEMARRNFQSVLVQTPEGLRKFDSGDPAPRPLAPADLLQGPTPLIQAFEKLLHQRRFFIETEGGISHIVTQSDLDKIPMRLVVIGYISVWETFLRDRVKS